MKGTRDNSERRFVKMHGLGNDFVIFDGRADGFTPSSELARAVADRKCGVGCDQVITLERSTRADLFMRIHNPDGSEAGACGNATRCVAALAFAETGARDMTIETRSGVLRASAEADGRITVDMGEPRLDWKDIPLARAMDTLDVDFAVTTPAGVELRAPVAVSMGNPHVVFFVEDAEAVDLDAVGPRIEQDPLFPERVNVSVAEVRGRDAMRVRVWERGAGVTLACGSAACACVVAATRRGLIDGAAAIEMDGGTLDLTWREDGHVLMTGPTATVFHGTLDLEAAP
ncbi:MAG: diaminopimelate epimerase [Alphaproteobacteria bacterium]|nr:MAG: diaminopimelate epimerase [Alphaproteobacteria bacterium]